MFFQTVNTVEVALSRQDDILSSSIRNLITSHPLIETVRMTKRELDTFEAELDELDGSRQSMEVNSGREEIVNRIVDQAGPKLERFGIELVDLNLKRLNYVEEVQNSVFQRMIAERKRIAEKHRSEGAGEARKIEGDMERDLKEISSEAYRKAAEIKGKADAESAKIYAHAFNRDPDFYSFYNTLVIYREVMDKNRSLFLSTDSNLLKYFKGLDGKSMDEGR
jgi:membrane protease subunit HflC